MRSFSAFTSSVLLAAVLTVPGSAQDFGAQLPVATAAQPIQVTAADFDGDGDADLAAILQNSTIAVYLNAGDGTFPNAPHVQTYTRTPTVLRLRDLDGDGDTDIVSLRPAEQGGGGLGIGLLTPLLNAGDGTFTAGATRQVSQNPYDLVLGDYDVDGDLDALLPKIGSGGGPAFFRNDGTGNFALEDTLNLPHGSYAVGDVDADGDDDVVVRVGGTLTTYANDGAGVFASIGAWPTDPGALWFHEESFLLADLDGDGDLDVVSGAGPFSGDGTVAVHRNPGDGTYATRTTVVLPNGEPAIAEFDADGDGDTDLAVGRLNSGRFTILENDGAAAFTSAGDFGVLGVGTASVACGDFDRDGDLDVAAAGSASVGIAVVRNATTTGTSACAGDGSGTACPCGNASPLGANAGCLNSFGVGAVLRGAGSASISDDELVLSGAQMPNAAVLYFQGTMSANAGAGALFGDGLRCATGTVRRIATRTNVGGASSVPAAGEPTISQDGLVLAPGERFYQAWYRNAAPYCTPSTFNLTNGLRVLWSP